MAGAAGVRSGLPAFALPIEVFAETLADTARADRDGKTSRFPPLPWFKRIGNRALNNFIAETPQKSNSTF